MALAKVRALHPDFFSDEDVSEVSIPARLLFAGLWCFACDNGHLADKSKQIKRWIYATDDVNVAELLRELEAEDLIVRAENWISIPGLMKRQRIDYRYFKTCDRDDCFKPEKPDSQPKTPRANAEPRSAPAGATRGPATDGDGDGDGDVTNTPPTDVAEAFDDFWAIYPRREGKGAAKKAWAKAVKSLPAAELLPVVRSYAVRVAGTEKRFIPFPATWLNQERWADEVTDQKAEASEGWFQPFAMPEPPADVADDPERYEAWAEGRRQAWRAGERW